MQQSQTVNQTQEPSDYENICVRDSSPYQSATEATLHHLHQRALYAQLQYSTCACTTVQSRRANYTMLVNTAEA